MANRLRKGTLCLIRSAVGNAWHDGKVVVVECLDKADDGLLGYQCSPQLLDPDGYDLLWIRESLIPLKGGDGMDEMLRKVGKPLEAECRN